MWVSLGTLLAISDARAGVQFFVNDPAGFAAATASLGLLGSEDWSSGSGDLQTVDDPLLPGVANGPFPNGVNPATGMSVQSNTLGAVGITPSPGGNLAFAPQGFAGESGNVQPSDQLSANQNDDGFDMIFGHGAVAAPVAVSLSPMFYRTQGTENAGTIAVRVFDETGTQLGTSSVPNVVDVLEDSFLGIVATDADVIGRINLWAAANAVAGADNIFVYAAPEPGALLAGAAALAVLATLRRR
jgi:hypothetical protein